jgi:hypothetical protein
MFTLIWIFWIYPNLGQPARDPLFVVMRQDGGQTRLLSFRLLFKGLSRKRFAPLTIDDPAFTSRESLLASIKDSQSEDVRKCAMGLTRWHVNSQNLGRRLLVFETCGQCLPVCGCKRNIQRRTEAIGRQNKFVDGIGGAGFV